MGPIKTAYASAVGYYFVSDVIRVARSNGRYKHITAKNWALSVASIPFTPVLRPGLYLVIRYLAKKAIETRDPVIFGVLIDYAAKMSNLDIGEPELLYSNVFRNGKLRAALVETVGEHPYIGWPPALLNAIESVSPKPLFYTEVCDPVANLFTSAGATSPEEQEIDMDQLAEWLESLMSDGAED